MTDRIHISVTQSDIDNGLQEDSEHCPIAQALWRMYPRAGWVEATQEWLTVCLEPDYLNPVFLKWDPPKSARNFMTKFDEEGYSAVEPFEFDADPLEPDLPN